MFFTVVAYDGTDAQAPERRLAVRSEHRALAAKMQDDGSLICGAGILGEDKEVIGSVMVYNFPTREAFEEHLKREPYVKGNVWEKIDIIDVNVKIARALPEDN